MPVEIEQAHADLRARSALIRRNNGLNSEFPTEYLKLAPAKPARKPPPHQIMLAFEQLET